jgi:hypothetical protein
MTTVAVALHQAATMTTALTTATDHLVADAHLSTTTHHAAALTAALHRMIATEVHHHHAVEDTSRSRTPTATAVHLTPVAQQAHRHHVVMADATSEDTRSRVLTGEQDHLLHGDEY